MTPMDQFIVGSSEFKFIDKKVKCIEYAPELFAFLRQKDNIDPQNLKETLNPVIDGNINAIKKSGEGMGKSGSFFFFSHDKKLLIKTMTTSDFNAWTQLFPKYFEHINMFEDSLIARVYGIYSV